MQIANKFLKLMLVKEAGKRVRSLCSLDFREGVLGDVDVRSSVGQLVVHLG